MSLFRPPSIERPGDQSSETRSGKKVPMAMSMMVDSMTSMVQRAKQDLERVDHRARADLELVDQRARKDVERLDQRARADHERLKRD